jgi:hypothetical protein
MGPGPVECLEIVDDFRRLSRSVTVISGCLLEQHQRALLILHST